MSLSPPLPRPRLLQFWTLVWLVAGVLHLTQAIWVHHGEGVPAGLGDGRFNHLVLEHGYQSWQGHYDWTSPGQFYPTKETLGWSDTHLGTLPAYILFRTLHFSPERAWQAWFILCAILNLVMGFRLLRQLGVDRALRGPIAFAAFAGVPAVWLAGTHPQILPIFPGLWALSQLLYFAERRQSPYLLLFIGGLAAQFAAGPYLAFFTGLVALFGAVFYRLTRVADANNNLPLVPPKPGLTSYLLASAGALLGLINLRVYLQSVSSGTERPMSELIDLCPTWVSWFSASPAHAWYSPGWPAQSPELSEHVLFAGFLPWILMLTAIGAGWRFRQSPLARSASLLGAIAFVLILFTVRWPTGFSIWLTIADWVEPLRGFRAIGRIVIFTHLLMIVSAGLILSFGLRAAASRRLPAWPILLISGLTVFETLGFNQPHYLVSDAVARREAVVQAWQENGDGEVLAFAPGFTNQTDPQLHLDAWAAALSRQRVTLNGYTGGAPSSHVGFIWTPTAANAAGLAQRLKLPEESVSIVTQLPAEISSQLGYQFFSERVLQELEGFDIPPMSWTLFAPPERFEFEDTVYYQFTPNAEVSFRIPDHASSVTFLIGGRPGSYSDGGDSDGFALKYSVAGNSSAPLQESEELINPRDNPAHRGFLGRSITLVDGQNRVLTLSFGPGPSGLNNWDWPLLGRLRLQ